MSIHKLCSCKCYEFQCKIGDKMLMRENLMRSTHNWITTDLFTVSGCVRVHTCVMCTWCMRTNSLAWYESRFAQKYERWYTSSSAHKSSLYGIDNLGITAVNLWLKIIRIIKQRRCDNRKEIMLIIGLKNQIEWPSSLFFSVRRAEGRSVDWFGWSVGP